MCDVWVCACVVSHVCLSVFVVAVMHDLFGSQQDELLASQHYDNNSVACIEDRCFVLGSRQYCRYIHNIILMSYTFIITLMHAIIYNVPTLYIAHWMKYTVIITHYYNLSICVVFE